MGSLNSNVRAGLGPARVANASHLLFGRSWFPETTRLHAADTICAPYLVSAWFKDQLVYTFAMSHQAPLRLPCGRPRRFDVEAAVERAMDVFWSRGYHATAL